MTTDREQFDDGEEAQVAWLLESGHDVPELPAKFAADLSKRLDAEFLLLHANGHTPDHVEAVTLPTKSRPRRHWMMTIAAAASVALAVAVASNPPAWAAAVRAIVERIEALAGVATDDDGGNALVADVGKPRPPVAFAPEQPRVARVEATKPEITPVAPPIADPPRQKNEPEKTAAQPKSPHPKSGASDWKPFDKPLPDAELSQRIDQQLAALWQESGIRPVEAASDAEFMRRAYLDLTGRIPTVSEVHSFNDDKSPNRRELLVDQLLSHRDHATHLAAMWHAVLLPTEVDLSRLGGGEKFDEWLADRFGANQPYDQIVRELLLAEGRVSDSGPLLFYAALKLNPEELAARSSRAFLGVRMECAQCHNHPFDNVSQHDFWSFAAFFARISRPRGKMEMTSQVLAVRDSERGDVSIPNSTEIVPPRLPLSDFDIDEKPGSDARRKQMVDWLTARNNGQFARAAVNRVWAQFFGRGLVQPVDDMRPDNLPIAPEVLDTLSRDFAASGFDLRRLMRAIVLTKTYQLSSRSEDNDPARTLNFAQMNVKSFTAEQLYDCIAVATQKSAIAATAINAPGLARFGDMSRQAFVEQFRAPTNEVTDYHSGIPQALTLMHGGLIQNATDLSTSGLLSSLAAPFFTDDQRLETLFLSTLSRQPETAERDVMLKAISTAKSDTDRQRALGDVLWALLNRAEFTFNH